MLPLATNPAPLSPKSTALALAGYAPVSVHPVLAAREQRVLRERRALSVSREKRGAR